MSLYVIPFHLTAYNTKKLLVPCHLLLGVQLSTSAIDTSRMKLEGDKKRYRQRIIGWMDRWTNKIFQGVVSMPLKNEIPAGAVVVITTGTVVAFSVDK